MYLACNIVSSCFKLRPLEWAQCALDTELGKAGVCITDSQCKYVAGIWRVSRQQLHRRSVTTFYHTASKQPGWAMHTLQAVDVNLELTSSVTRVVLYFLAKPTVTKGNCNSVNFWLKNFLTSPVPLSSMMFTTRTRPANW